MSTSSDSLSPSSDIRSSAQVSSARAVWSFPDDTFTYDSFIPLGPSLPELPYHLFRHILEFHPKDWEIPATPTDDPANEGFVLTITFIHTIGTVCRRWRAASLASLGTVLVVPPELVPSIYPRLCLEYATTLALQRACKSCRSNRHCGMSLEEDEILVLLRELSVTNLEQICVGDTKTMYFIGALHWDPRCGVKSTSQQQQQQQPRMPIHLSSDQDSYPCVSPFQVLTQIAMVARREGVQFPNVEKVFVSYPCSPFGDPPESQELSEEEVQALESVFPNVRRAALTSSFLSAGVWADRVERVEMLRPSMEAALAFVRKSTNFEKLGGIPVRPADPSCRKAFSELVRLLNGRPDQMPDCFFRLDLLGNDETDLFALAGGRPFVGAKTVTLEITRIDARGKMRRAAEFLSGEGVEHVIVEGHDPFLLFFSTWDGGEVIRRSIRSLLDISDRTVVVSLTVDDRLLRNFAWYPLHGPTGEMNPFLIRDSVASSFAEALSCQSHKEQMVEILDANQRRFSMDLDTANSFQHSIGVNSGATECFVVLIVIDGFPSKKWGYCWDDHPWTVPRLRMDMPPATSTHICFLRDPLMNFSVMTLLSVAEAAANHLSRISLFAGNIEQPLEDGAFRTPAFCALDSFLSGRGYCLLDMSSDRADEVRKDIAGQFPQHMRRTISMSMLSIFVWEKDPEFEQRTDEEDVFPPCLTLELMVRMLEVLKRQATALMLDQTDPENGKRALELFRETKRGVTYAENIQTCPCGRQLGLSVSLNVSLCLLRTKRYKDCLLACRDLLRFRAASLTPQQSAKIRCRMGRCFEAYRQNDKAIRQYRAALAVLPSCEFAKRRLRVLAEGEA